MAGYAPAFITQTFHTVPKSHNEDSNCFSGVFQYWTLFMNHGEEKILQDKIFQKPISLRPKIQEKC